MSAVTQARYDRVCHDLFRNLLLTWVATLNPRKGWEGTAAELWVELAAADVQAGRSWIPAGAGLSQNLKELAGVLQTAGWNLSFSRTKSARKIHFAKRRG